MQVQNVQSPNFTGLYVKPEAVKTASGKLLNRAAEIVSDTKYAHVYLVGKNAAPVIVTSKNAYAGPFSGLSPITSMVSAKYQNDVKPKLIIDAFDGYDCISKGLNLLNQSTLEEKGVSKPIRFVFDSKEAQKNVCQRIHESGNIYDRAAIIAKIYDSMIRSSLGEVSSQKQIFKPLDLTLESELGLKEVGFFTKISNILSNNKTVSLSMRYRRPEAAINTLYYHFIGDCKALKLKYNSDSNLLVKTTWGGEPIVIRNRRSGKTDNILIKYGSPYYIKLPFENDEQAQKAYYEINNAKNKYERMALLAKYMDELGLGKII